MLSAGSCQSCWLSTKEWGTFLNTHEADLTSRWEKREAQSNTWDYF